MSPLFQKLSSRQLIVYGVTLLFVFALVVGGLQSQSVSDMRSIREWAHHSRAFQLALTHFRVSLLEAESSQRGYLLTHDEIFLEPYGKAIAESSDQFQLLRSLTADNAVQQSHLNEMEPLLNEKLQFMAQTISLEKSGNHAGAVQLVNGGDGRQDMINVLTVVDTMQDSEAQLLSDRQNAYQHNFKINTVLSVASLSLCFVSIILILIVVRYLEQLQASVMLTALAEMIEYEKGNITVEEYMRRRHRALAPHGQAQVEAERLLKLFWGVKDKKKE